jgi:hypothetical protein
MDDTVGLDTTASQITSRSQGESVRWRTYRMLTPMSLQNLIDRSTTFVRISKNRMMFYYVDTNYMMIQSYKDVVEVPGGAAEDVPHA